MTLPPIPNARSQPPRLTRAQPYVLGLPVRSFRRVVLTVVYALHGLSTLYFLSVAYLMLNLTPFEASSMRAYAPRPSSVLFLGMALLHLTPFLEPLLSSTRRTKILRQKPDKVPAKSLAPPVPQSPALQLPRMRIPPNVSMAIGHFLEIVSETWIAAQMAQRLVDRHISLLYAMVLVSNCLITTWALLFRSTGLKKTLIALLDACLSFLLSAGIPLFLFLLPLVEYKFYGTGNESHDFEWLARSVTSVRTLIVWSPIQPIMVVVPSIMNYLVLRAVAKRVRTASIATMRNVPADRPNAGLAGLRGVFVRPKPTVATASLDISLSGTAMPSFGSRTASNTFSSSINSYGVASPTRAFSWQQEHGKVLGGVIVLSVVWGVAVLVVAVAAEFYRHPCPPGCILASAPWLSRSCNCIYFRWTCNASDYDDVLDPKLHVSQLGPNLLFLHIRKCGVRHGLAADTMGQMQALYGFHFEQTAMTEWNIPSSAFPTSIVLAMIRYSALDHVPIALQQPSTNLRSIFIVGSPLRAIPDSILQNWQHLNSLWLSSTNLTEFPLPVLQMDGLEVLALDSNQISTIPPGLHLLPHLYWVYLESNNISTFPDAMVTARTGLYLYLNHNPIEFIADNVVALLNPKFADISSTLFCKHRQHPSLCGVDCSNTCSRSDEGNFFCDPKCNSTECEFDRGDCNF